MVARPIRFALLLALAVSCARGAQRSDEELPYPIDSTITIRVVNRSQLDAIIYLVHGGARERLGTVTAATTASFPVRTRTLGAGGEFSLYADPVGATRGASTEPLSVSQGSTFTWTLESDFSRGSVMVQD